MGLLEGIAHVDAQRLMNTLVNRPIQLRAYAEIAQCRSGSPRPTSVSGQVPKGILDSQGLRSEEGMTVSEQLDLLIQKLIDRLNADDPVTRRNAAGSLRLHGERAVGAIPELVKHLSDEHPEVRNEVRRALDRLRRAAAA
jgi:hypothetical protein